jgi:hypothetical protein
MRQGILVGADKNIEWLLPWWWKYYSLYNNFPVAFADFGLSPKGVKWCQKHGDVISIASHRIASKKKIPVKRAKLWEKKYTLPSVWEVRKAWFQKPFALLQTPFEETAWIDLDCEVCASLTPLFDSWDRSKELALVREIERPSQESNLYNSGVIVFRKDAPFLSSWAQLCLQKNDRYLTDQHALSDLLARKQIPFQKLPDIFNWNICGQRDIPLTPVIIHWLSAWGKEFIRTHGGFHEFFKNG